MERSYFDLSEPQKAIWLTHQLYDEMNHSVTVDVLFRAKPDIIIARRAVNLLYLYNQILRAELTVIDGAPKQFFNEHDASKEYAIIREFRSPDEYKKWVEEYALQKMGDVLCEISIIDAGTEFGFLIKASHMIIDGTSAILLLTRLKLYYNSIVIDEEIVETEYRYQDFIKRECLYYKDSAALIRDREYWRKKMAEIETPTIVSSNKMNTVISKRSMLRLSADSENRLRNYCKENDVSEFGVLLSCFALCASAHFRTDLTTIFCTVLGRVGLTENKTPGMFVNTIPLTMDCGNESISKILPADFIKAAQKEFFNSSKHFRYSYNHILSDYYQLRGRQELSDINFSYQNFEALSFADYSSEEFFPTWYFCGTQTNSLSFHARREPKESLKLLFEYQVEKFTEEDISIIGTHLLETLNSLFTRPGAKTSELEMIDARERGKILTEFNDTYAEYPMDKTVVDLFEEQVRRTPENTALKFEEQTMTYAELNAKANRLAYRLRELGIKPDDHVALLAERSMEMIIGIIGTIKAGGAYVPVDPGYPEDRIRYMLEDSACGVVLTCQSAAPVGMEIPVLDLSDERSYAAAYKNPPHVNNPNDLIYIIYTSGTTGKPKGVLIEHRGVVNLWKRLGSDNPCGDDTVLQFASISFDASVYEIVLSLLYGGALCVIPHDIIQDTKAFERYVKDHDVRIALFPPSYTAQIDLKLFRRVLTAGSAANSDIVNRANQSGAEYTNEYGPTEATVVTCNWDCRAGTSVPAVVPIGRPELNKQVYILNEMKLCGIGAPGELCIAGVGLARGYLNQPGLTAEKFIKNPYGEGRMYRTGDLARWLPDGNIECLGRIDEQVKIRGFRIELGEIESVLRKQPGVADAAAMIRIVGGDDTLCAYLVPERGQDPDTSVIRESLKKELPEYMLPAFMTQLEALPLNRNGKLDKRALPEPDALTGREYSAPGTEMERVVVEVFEVVLGISPIGIDDNFFELGGHSLKATTMVNMIEKFTGIRLALRTIFTSPTPKTLARELELQERELELPAFELELPAFELELPACEPESQAFELELPVCEQLGSSACEQLGSLVHELEPQEHDPESQVHDLESSERELKLPACELEPTTCELELPACELELPERVRYKPIPKAEKKENYAMSSAQKRLFILDQIAGGCVVYNIPAAIEARGELELERIQKAMNGLMRRHETLRTSFALIDGEAVQTIADEVDCELELEYEETELYSAEGMTEFIRPFDLGKAPLMRLKVIKELSGNIGNSGNRDNIGSSSGSGSSRSGSGSGSGNSNRYILLFDIHHIIADAATLSILIEEFSRLYGGEELKPLEVQYKDYSEWMRGRDFGAQREYWMNVFAEEAPILDLATDYPRPQTQSYGGSFVSAQLNREQRDGIEKINRGNGTTAFMTLLAVFMVELHKYSRQEDVVVGVPMSGRVQKDAETMMGMFVNTLALRGFPSVDKSFTDFLAEIRESALGAYENQEYPFELLVDDVHARRDMSRNPLFDVMFAMQNNETAELYLGDAKLKVLEISTNTAKFDLTLQAEETESGYSLSLEYCDDLFTKASALAMLDHFINLINSIIANPYAKISELEMTSVPERERILVEFNDTSVGYSVGKTVVDLFEEQVQKTPENTALKFEGQTMTYSELNAKANKLARRLRGLGISPNTCVAIIAERGMEMIVGILGTIKAGGAYVPIDPEYPEDRIRYMLEDSAASVVLTHRSKAPEGMYITELDLGDESSYEGSPGEGSSGESSYEGSSGESSYEGFYAEGSSDEGSYAEGLCDKGSYDEGSYDKGSYTDYEGNLPSVNNPSDLIYVIYTSGTTGKPKGVMIEHHGVVNLRKRLERNKPCETDTVLQFASLSFDAATYELALSLLFGGALCVIPNTVIQDTKAFEKYIENHDVTMALLPPSYAAQVKLRQFRRIITGGSAANRDTVIRADRLGIEYTNEYGPTEVTVTAGSWDYHGGTQVHPVHPVPSGVSVPGEASVSRALGNAPEPGGASVLGEAPVHGGASVLGEAPVLGGTSVPPAPGEASVQGEASVPAIPSIPSVIPIGRPIENTQIYIMNGSELCGIGVPGELRIAGAGLARGYLNQPELTKKRFIKNPYGEGRLYRSGDLARWLPDGNIEYLGRLDEQVKIRGYRIELGEIESVLRKQPEVADAAVVTRIIGGDETLCAYVVPQRYRDADVPGAEQQDRDSDTPGIPQQYRDSDTLGPWQVPDIPGAPQQGEESDMPGVPQQYRESDTPEHRQVPDIPGAPQQGEESDMPGIPQQYRDSDTPEPGQVFDVSAIRERLRKELPEYMIPAFITKLDVLPLNRSGKLDRRALPEPDALAGREYTAPSAEMERVVVEVFEEILGMSPIGINDSFFELGGHSLRATVAVNLIEKRVGVRLPLHVVFTSPTPSMLAKELTKELKALGQGGYKPIPKAEKKDSYAMSSAQKRMFILNQVDGGSTVYNMPTVIEVKGALDFERIQSAMDGLIKRHDALRTSFALIGEEAVQIIADEAACEVEYAEAEIFDEETENAEAEIFDAEAENGKAKIFDEETENAKAEIFNAEAEKGKAEIFSAVEIAEFIRPFDLSKAPLIRLKVIKESQGDRYILLFDMHHIIADGMTANILISEFSKLYGGEALKPPEVQFKDYSEWMRGCDLGAQREYWLNVFAKEAPALDLATDYPRPLTLSHKGSHVSARLNREQRTGIEKINKENETTVFMTLLAAFMVELHKYSRQEDVVVGVPLSGRVHKDFESMMGMFVNTLALRGFPSGEKSFTEFLAEIKEHALNAYENQEYPFEELVENVETRRDMSRNPLFDVMFVVQNNENVELRLGDAKLRTLEINTNTAKFDLTLQVQEQETKKGGYSLSLEYCADLFTEATAKALLEHFINLVDSIIANPGAKISELDMISEPERERILAEFNDTYAEYQADKTIVELFEEQVLKAPQNTALKFNGQTMTYDELNEKANRLAHRLRELHIKPDDHVAILAERSMEMIVGIFGTIKAGGAYVPIDPEYPDDRIRYILEDSAPKALLTYKSTTPGGLVIPTLNLSDENSYAAEADNPSHINTPNDLIYIIYTSGATGKPKGVMIEHRGVVNLRKRLERVNLCREDTVLQSASLSFDAATAELMSALLFGAALCIVPSSVIHDTKVLDEYAGKHDVTVAFLTPGVASQVNLRQYRRIITGGSNANRDTVIRADELGVDFTNEYGPSEATVLVSDWDHPRGTSVPSVIPIGRPIENTQVYILDGLRLCGIGVPGELCVSGVGLARGYLNQPEFTAEKFIRNPFGEGRLYRSGDLARWLPDGNIDYLGRINEQVKIRGRRIELGEIESVLRKQPGVADAVVVTRKIGGGETLCAYLVPRQDGEYDLPRRDGDNDLPLRDGESDLPPRDGESESPRRGLETESQRWDREPNLPRRDGEYDLPRREGEYDSPQRDGESDLPPREAGPNAPAQEQARDFQGQALDMVKIKEGLRKELPEYMLPAFMIQIEALPLNRNGKLDKRALPEPDSLAVREYTAPGTEMERVVVETFEKILGLSPIGMEESFFELGGHSLRATIAVNMLEKATGIRLPLKTVFAAPTPSMLAKELEALGEGGYKPIPKAEKKDRYTMSSAQKRLFVLDQIDSGSAAYNIPTAIEAMGELDIDRIRKTMDKLIVRHEALRTSFALIDGEAVQIIADEAFCEVECAETESFDSEEMAKFIRPFDLGKAPLIRLKVLKERRSGRQILLFDIHHIIADGMAMITLTEEFSRLYSGEALNPLEIQYKDYSEWMRDCDLGAQREYWMNAFAEEAPILDLATDYPRPQTQSYRGSHVYARLNEDQKAGVEKINRENGTTTFMTLLAAFMVELHKYSRQEDIVVGVPISGRTHKDTETMMGMFVNTLALRGRPSAEKPFTGFLAEIKDHALGAYENQEYPFEKLVEDVDVRRDMSRNPLFDVMFAVQNNEKAGFQIGEIELRALEISPNTAKFDLSLQVEEMKDGYDLSLEYCSDLYTEATASGMLEHFINLVNSIIEKPGAKISELEMTSAPEREMILTDFNDTFVEYPGHKTAVGLFEEQVLQNPQSIALKYERQTMTYADLNAKANRLAYKLMELGISPERKVALITERGMEMVVGILGTIKAGGAYVPVDPGYPEDRIRYILEDSEASAVLTYRTKAPEGTGVPTLDLEAAGSYTGKECNPPHVNSPGDLIYVIYTSGTTGKPKGVMVEHRGVVNLTMMYNATYQLNGGDTLLQYASMSFDQTVADVFAALLSGASLCLTPSHVIYDFEDLHVYMNDNNVTVASLTPKVIQELCIEKLPSLRLLESGGEAGNIENLRELAKKITVLNAYGPTESTVNATVMKLSSKLSPELSPELSPDISLNLSPDISSNLSPDLSSKISPDLSTKLSPDLSPNLSPNLSPDCAILPIGKPVVNTRIYILNGLELCGTGVPGELCIAGGSLARGYLNQPELTAEKFIMNPYGEGRLYRSGDLARWLPDGNIDFLGRIDEQVKIRGFRIELGEIESVLRKQPGVADAAVVVREAGGNSGDSGDSRDSGDRVLCAYLTAEQGKALDMPAIREGLGNELPEYMIPAFMTQMETLPLNRSGKLDKRALPEPDALAGREYTAPRTDMERSVIAAFEEVLGISPVGIEDSFFELGGDSLKLIRVASTLRENGYYFEVANLMRLRTAKLICEHYRIADKAVAWAALRPNRNNPGAGELEESIKTVMHNLLRQYGNNYKKSERFSTCQALFMHRIFLFDIKNILVNFVKINSDTDGALSALHAIISSQGALRTRYNVETRCLEEYEYYDGWEIPILDASNYSEDLDMYIELLANSASELNFLADNMLLSRLLLIKIDEENCVLLSAIHHSIWDGVSQELLLILINEFFENGCNSLSSYSYTQYCKAFEDNVEHVTENNVEENSENNIGNNIGNNIENSIEDGFEHDFEDNVEHDVADNNRGHEADSEVADDIKLYSELTREASELNTCRNPAYWADFRITLNDSQKDKFVNSPVDTAMALLAELMYGDSCASLPAIPFTVLRHNRNELNGGMLGMTLNVNFTLFDVEKKREMKNVSSKYPNADLFSMIESMSPMLQYFEEILSNSSIPIINYLGIFHASDNTDGVFSEEPYIEIGCLESGDNDVYIEFYVQDYTLNASILGLNLEKQAIKDAISKL